MDTINRNYAVIGPMLLVIITTVLPGLLYAAEVNTTVIRFRSVDKRYFVVINRNGTNQESSSFCQLEFGGRLAAIQTERIQYRINAELRLFNTMQTLRNDSSNELWIRGRTNVTSGILNVTEDILNEGSSGPLCMVMADRPTADQEMLFNVYPKECDNVTDSFICETTRSPPYKYLYMESSDQCTTGVYVANASVYMGQDGCRRLGGGILTAPSVENVVLCQFDICGTNTMEESQGIVIAALESCPGDDVFPVYLSSMTGPQCPKLGGRHSSFLEGGFAFPQPHCELSACRKTKVPNSSTFTFSSSGGNCSIDDHVGSTIVMVNSSEHCYELHSRLAMLPQESTPRYNHTCWMDLCRLGIPDCKTTEQGKEYTGRLSVTISGKTCQRWDSRVPHDHGNNNPDWFPDTFLADAANYCRNPGDWMEGPFCYTTDPETTWEICELPFCKGHGATVKDFKIGTTRYIYVPGRHTDPTEYCAKAYGASPAVIKGEWEIKGLQGWLRHLTLNQEMTKQEVWLGGRARVGPGFGVIFNDYDKVLPDAKEGMCLMLSNWDEQSQLFNGSIFHQYTNACPQYYDSFLCEVSESRIEHYEVHGGVPQIGVHDQDSCIISCQEGCLAVGYDSLEESCWHYTTVSSSPGRAKWNFLYVQKAQSVCHNYLILMDQNVVMNASSLRSDPDQGVVSADQAKITSKCLVTDDGVSAGAWIPETLDTKQWIQAKFSQVWVVYGLLVQGMECLPDMQLKTFKIQTSLYPGCTDLTALENDKVFNGGSSETGSVTIILERAILVHCIRLIPLTWNRLPAVRFDVIGCTERNNVALRGSVLPAQGVDTPSWKLIDGFTSPLTSWKTCVLSSKQNNPWFALTLPEYYDVEEVVLYTRKECCDGELREVSVKVLMVPPAGTTFTRSDECGYISSPVIGSHKQTVTCSPRKTGKYVQIQKNALSSQIALCEIKLHGYKSLLQNLALKKAAYQSDTTGTALADRAVDGNPDGNYYRNSCSATSNVRDSQWWMVDLGGKYTVKHVVIYTRTEGTVYTRNLAIYVGESRAEKDLVDSSNLCGTEEKLVLKGTKLHKTCTPPLNGRYVRLVMNYKSSLYLCEVEVLAEPVKIRTYSGNAETAAFCHLPFTYKNNTHYSCISDGSDDRDGRFWCATTPDYDTDQTWGYCIDVSLWGGRSQSEGVVLVRGANKKFAWGTVCDDDWDDTDAKIVCKLLGYTDGRAMYPPFFAAGPGHVAIGNVKCKGNEMSIMACEYQATPSHCTHYEDAAVKCEQHNIFPSFGYPAAKRQQKDSLPQGIFILQADQEITVPGKVVSWRFYSMKPESSSKLSLQVWRRMYDLEGMRFLLVGSVDVSNALVDDGEVTIADAQLIHVQSGDLIGFTYTGGNSIPYDTTFHCGHHGRVWYRSNTTVPIGGITSFIAKEDAHLGCRLYSLFVKIEVQAIQSLNEFLFEGRLYRIHTVPNTKASADVLCINKFGLSSHVLHLESQSEYQYVKNFLQDAGLKGEIWMNNTLRDGPKVVWADWAPCQPEEGKECLMLSSLNKDGRFMWYSTTCQDKHYFICETDAPDIVASVTASSTVGITKSSQITAKPKYQPNKSTDGRSPVRRWPIIVGLLVPALVIGIAVIVVAVFLKYKRSGRKAFDYPLITQDAGFVNDEVTNDGQMSVTSEPSKGSVSLHKINDDY